MSFSMWQKLMAARMPTAVSPAARAVPIARGRTRSMPWAPGEKEAYWTSFVSRETSLGLGAGIKKGAVHWPCTAPMCANSLKTLERL